MELINNEKLGILSFVISFYTNGNMIYSEYEPENEKFSRQECITLENLELISNEFSKKQKKEGYNFKGFIPRNVLYYESNKKKIVWFSEPRVQEHLFKSENIKSGKYPLPYLLWNYDNGRLSVFALSKEPNLENDILYHSPLLNVYSDGSVCLGSTNFKFKSNDYEHIMKVVESAFFNSYFTHTNHNNIIKGNLIEFYKKHKNKKTFPNELLIETGIQLKSLI